jgi:ribose transport system substrate-binding protein
MNTYQRHQTILRMLEDSGSVTVLDLAVELAVSEATIRNDLNQLEEQQLLTRIRGGAIPMNGHPVSSPFQSRVHKNAGAKKKIAQWASELVMDGDVILLDASSTAYHMAAHLRDRHNITVVTHQIDAARLLATDPSKQVILLGGYLRADGAAVTGEISQEILRNLHLNTAFISCVGFTFEAGLMEGDIEEARLKHQALRSSARVVALIDSSKFGKVGLRPFASLRDISHIVTDDGLDVAIIDRLREANVALTVCGATTVKSLMHQPVAQRSYKIGFANLSEALPFSIDVRRGLEKAAQKATSIDLVYVDNNLDGSTAVRLADALIAQQVDLVIEYQIDEAAGHMIMNKFMQAQIPVIAIDIPMMGATYFGVDNFLAGRLAGEALARWITSHWQGHVDYVLVLEERRAGALPAARIQGQLHGLRDVIERLPAERLIFLDSGNTSQTSYRHCLDVLSGLPEGVRVAFVCFNDDAAMGALHAISELKRQPYAAIVGQGADRTLRDEIRRPSSPVVGSTAFMPERYGERIIDIALRLLRGEPVPPAVYMEHAFIDASNIDQHYPDDFRAHDTG